MGKPKEILDKWKEKCNEENAVVVQACALFALAELFAYMLEKEYREGNA